MGRDNCSSDLIVIDIQIFYHLRSDREGDVCSPEPIASIINVADNLAGFIIVLIDQACDSVMV